MSPSENHFINIHSHRKPLSADEWVLRNAFHVSDKDKVSKLKYAVSVGLHPWFVTRNYENQIEFLANALANDNVLAIGEIGLDRVINVDLELQKQVFEAQLKLSVQHSKPIIIHAVKTYPDLIPYLKNYPITFILHQYRGNVQQTEQFLKHPNVFFSFGKDLIKKPEKVVTSINEIPLNKIFLETDVANYNIRDIYQAAAQLKEISVAELKRMIYQNFATIFKNV